MILDKHPDHREPCGLKAIGYWKNEHRPDLPDVNDHLASALPPGVKEVLVAYLQESNPQVQVYGPIPRGFSICRVCGQANGSADLTDGTFIWPEGLAHYVEAHNLDLHEAFLDHVSRQLHAQRKLASTPTGMSGSVKTASEARHEYEETQKVLAEARQKRREEFLKNLPPSEDPKVTGLRRGVLEGRYKFSNLACDHCRTELVHDNEILSSYPPQRRHYCSGCGASFTLSAYLKS